MDTYEVLTILQRPDKPSQVLRRVYLDVDYETDDRNSFVYTRTRKIKTAKGKYPGHYEMSEGRD